MRDGPSGFRSSGGPSSPTLPWCDMCWHIATTHVLKHTFTEESLKFLEVLTDPNWFYNKNFKPSAEDAPIQVRHKNKKPKISEEQLKDMQETTDMLQSLKEQGATAGQPLSAIKAVLERLPSERIHHVTITNLPRLTLSELLDYNTDNAVIINRLGHVWSAGYILNKTLTTLASWGDILYGSVACEIIHDFLLRSYPALPQSPGSFLRVTPQNQYDYNEMVKKIKEYKQQDVDYLKQIAAYKDIAVGDEDTQETLAQKLVSLPEAPRALKGERFKQPTLPGKANKIAEDEKCILYNDATDYFIQERETNHISLVRNNTNKKFLLQHFKLPITPPH